VAADDIATRQATPADQPFLLNCFLRSMRETITACRGQWDEVREREQFEHQLVLETTHVIQLDGVDVGFLMLVEEPATLQLHTLCVVPDYQGRGIGSQVTRNVISEGQRRRRRVILSVLTSNIRAAALYERLGFRVVGESEHHRYMEHVA
jgi:ribosomal protein S18 acetylase RimI-like enzyme